MRILALESSSKTVSIAALQEDRLLVEKMLDPSRRSAQTLTPGLKQLLKEVNWRIDDIDLIAVTTGPGSFTGLRIGLTTSKTLAYTANAEVIGVNTLEVIANQVPVEVKAVSAVMNAQRQELFAASFARDENDRFQQTAETKIVSEEKWLAGLEQQSVVTGPGLVNVLDRLQKEVQIVDESLWQPMASSLGQVAYQNYQAGQRDDLWKLLPNYFRKSAAEEQWEKLGR